ncbi:MAG: hypothetical protein KDB22_28000 [Planctomycetales bacterium]|nr:hypothetical protein [Planctomycetales bacterium]
MRHPSRPLMRFYLVAYRKDGKTNWCKTAMDAQEAEDMVSMLRQADVQAKAVSISITGDIFDRDDELTFDAESQV